MNSRDLVYWLQGYFEIRDAGPVDSRVGLSPEQVDIIKRHLALVFVHEIDPSAGPKEHQEKLNEIHHGDGHVSASQDPPRPMYQNKGGVTYRC